MSKKVPIVLKDELLDDEIMSNAQMDLDTGEITSIEYIDYSLKEDGLPAANPDYTCTSGIIKFQDKEVEFAIDVDTSSGDYSINVDELEEIKEKAMKLLSKQSITKTEKPTKKKKM